MKCQLYELFVSIDDITKYQNVKIPLLRREINTKSCKIYLFILYIQNVCMRLHLKGVMGVFLGCVDPISFFVVLVINS